MISPIYKLRYLILGLMVAAVMGLAVFLPRLKIDNSFEIWFVEDDPALIRYKTFLHTFGNDEVVVTVISGGGLQLSEANLKKLRKLTDDMAGIQGIGRVFSLTQYARMMTSFTANPFLEGPGESEGHLQEVEKVLKSTRITQRFINEKRDAFVLYTWLDTLENLDMARREILHNIDSLCAATFKKPMEIYHGGTGVIIDALNDSFISESGFFLPVSYGLILLIVFLLTRNWRWVASALVAIFLTTIALFSVMSVFNRPVTMISMALPPLVLIISVANIMHFSRYISWKIASGADGLETKWRAFLTVLKPCFFNALTTACGFLALSGAKMAVTRDYGIFAAFSVITSFILSAAGTMTVLKNAKGGLTGFKTNLAVGLLESAQKHKTLVVVCALAFISICIYGITRITVDTYSIRFLPEKHKVRRHSDKIESRAGNYLPLEFVIHIEEGLDWMGSDFLSTMLDIQEKIVENTPADAAYSFANMVFDAYAMQYGDWEGDGTNQEAEQKLRKTAVILGGAEASAFLSDKNKSAFRMTCMVPMSSARRLWDIGGKIEKIAETSIDTMGRIEKTGYLPLYSRLISNLIADQVTSILLAVLSISVLIALLLRSIRMLVISLAVNIIPLLGVLGIMGYGGIFLDAATVTIAPAILGIIVDDTLHLLFHLKRGIGKGKNVNEALKETAGHTGTTLIATSLILIVGFGIMGLSRVSSISLTGVLIAAAVGMALVTDLMLLPVLAGFILKKKV